jgi:multidrug resistance efflux pump
LDIARPPAPKRRRYALIAGGLAAVVLTTVALARLEPAAPTVERATLWTDSVQRGAMIRQVRGPGTLVPERTRWISAVTAGRVEAILVQPGATVEPETVLLELSNPEVQLQMLEAQRQLAAAEAELVNLQTSLETQRLNQDAAVASARANYQEAARTANTSEQLAERGLIARNDASTAKDRAAELATRLRIEEQRLEVMARSAASQLTVQRSQVERLRSIETFQRRQIEALRVRAGASGVVQEVSLQIGQWANPGATLARLVEPGRLKAVLRVPETQARDVTLGQAAAVDTRNGVVPGRVVRIDPAVQNGTVTVDVALEGELPRGARPDLSVDGTIEIERLADVLHLGRPAYGQPESTVGLFRLAADGKSATRIPVKLGRGSVNRIEILEGLSAGDVVILSDMSAWDAAERVKVK